MSKDSLRQWSTTAASNLDVGGVTLAENTMKPSDVNNAVRTEMAQTAQYLVEMSYPTAGGTANALTLTPTTALAALASNQAYTFNAASANTTAATLAVSGLTAKAIRKIVGGTDVALAANDIQANGRYTVVYDTAANSAAGAWVITGPSSLSGAYLPLAGGTLTGDLIISKANPAISLNKAASGQGSELQGRTNNLLRWRLLLGEVDAESGGNAGSGFYLYRYDDAGSLLDAVLTFARNSDAMQLPKGQIAFPAAQNASSGANTLDDYEEGTWTPSITFGGAAVGITYSLQLGGYIKVGRQVTAWANVLLTNKGSSTGAAVLGGLPFTSETTANANWCGIAGFWGGMTSIVGNIVFTIGNNSTSATVRMSGAATSPATDNTNFSNSSQFLIFISYFATA